MDDVGDQVAGGVELTDHARPLMMRCPGGSPRIWRLHGGRRRGSEEVGSSPALRHRS